MTARWYLAGWPHHGVIYRCADRVTDLGEALEVGRYPIGCMLRPNRSRAEKSTWFAARNQNARWGARVASATWYGPPVVAFRLRAGCCPRKMLNCEDAARFQRHYCQSARIADRRM